MADRLRARIAVRALGLARHLLRITPSDGDYDTCVFCHAPGCESGTADHDPDCPSLTNLYPVTLGEMWPHGPAQCEACGVTLWPGDNYSHIPQGEIGGTPVYEVACVGCAVLAGVSDTDHPGGGEADA